MKYNIFILLSLLFVFKLEAQNNIHTQYPDFTIQINIPTQKNNKVYFGQYWHSATYAKDSIQLSDEGKATLSFIENLPGGQYFIHIKPEFHLDLLIDDNQSDIKFYIDETDFTKNSISGSKDTQLLWDYLNDLEKRKQKRDDLEKQLDDLNISKQKQVELKNQLEKLDNNTKQHIESLITKHNKEWFGSFLKGMEPITLPFPKPKSDKEFSENKSYGKIHFFDNIDLTDPRLWQTSYLNGYIDTYMQKWVEQVPDSLAEAASKLVAKTQINSFCFKEMLSKFTNESMKSKKMGDENIWARLAEDYILDKNLTWIDSTQVLEIRRMYETIKNNRIGMKAHNLILETMNRDTIDTNNIPADYLLLYFYSPSCSHCQIEMPQIHDELYVKYKDKGLEVITINVDNNKENWKEFINRNKLTDWINCADMNYTSQYWMYYNVSGTPSSFVLDKNKIIIAKNINKENLEKLFDYYLKDKDGTN